jgi:hypothetical protein
MYRTLVLDPALREKLGELTDQMEVRDEAGKVVGMYLPVEVYQYFLRTTKIPFSKEEIEQFKQSGGGCSLADFWKRMGVS